LDTNLTKSKMSGKKEMGKIDKTTI